MDVEPPAPFLPLEHIELRLDVTGPFARTEVVERFRNTSDELVDAVYVFPLPPGAAIADLHLRIGTREIDGEIQDRAAARAAFEAARDEGHTAALTEELASDVYTLDVANLPPGEAIEVTIGVVAPVSRVGDQWQTTLPLAAPPRFLRLGASPVLPGPDPRDTGVRADVDLSVQAGTSIRALDVSAPVRERADLFGSAARLSLDGMALGQDLVVRWDTARSTTQVGLLRTPSHALIVVEGGSVGIDRGGCPLADLEEWVEDGVIYTLGRVVGPCTSVSVGPVVAWARDAVDPRTLEASWARRVVAREPDLARVRALGLAYGIVTPMTSLVAVDSSGPQHSARTGDPAPYDVSRFVTVDSTSTGTVLTKEFLQRIPTGRSYQSANQMAPGVTDSNLGTWCSNENTYILDGHNLTDPVVGGDRWPALVPSLRPAATLDRAWAGYVDAGGFASAAAGARLDAFTSGALGDRVAASTRLAGGARPSLGLETWGAAAELASLHQQQASVRSALELGELGPSRRWSTVDAVAQSFGDGVAGAASASRRTIDDGEVDAARVAGSARGHSGRVEGVVAVESGLWSRRDERDWTVLASHFAGHLDWDRQVWAEARLDQIGDRWLPSGGAEAHWREVRVSASRYVDREQVLPTSLSADAPAHDTAEVWVGAAGPTVAGHLGAEAHHDVVPFALPPALDALPDAPVESVERWYGAVRATASLDLGPASFAAGFAARPWSRGLRDPLTADPRAPFVPGYLDALRPLEGTFAATWSQGTTALRATVRLASGVGEEGGWLGPVVVVGARADLRLVQHVSLNLGARHAVGHPGSVGLPLQALSPGGVAFGDVPQIEGDASLALRF